MINILMADDHKLLREGLKRYLQEVPDIIVADEADNGKEIISKADQNSYDVILLDISMPGMSGIDALKQLKINHPDVKVLILSMHAEEEYAERALKAGASGYLTKNTDPRELIKAIRQVAAGRKYITATLAERLTDTLGPGFEKMPEDTLSDREYEIMCLIAAGKTPTEIAAELNLSRKTVSTHRTHILKKMRLSNNAQLIHYAVKNHLVD